MRKDRTEEREGNVERRKARSVRIKASEWKIERQKQREKERESK